MGMGQVIDATEFVKQIEKAIANGIATLDASAKVPKNQINLTSADVGAIANTGNEVLTVLNATSGTISASVLPSYVDDFLEFATLANFPATGETGKIYLAQNTNLSYRWTGSVYVDISSAGIADAALRLNTPRTISGSAVSDVSFSFSFDGSVNIEAALTLKNVAAAPGTFPKVTFNSKGLVTGGTNLIANDIPNLDWGKITSGIPENIAYLANNTNNPPDWHVYVPTRNYGATPVWTPATVNSSLENTLVFRSNNGSIWGFDSTFNGSCLIGGNVPSTSPTTGALRITNGGLGVVGDIFSGGSGIFTGCSAFGSTSSRNTSVVLNISETFNANGGRFGLLDVLTIDNSTALTANRSQYGSLFRLINNLSTANKSSFSFDIYGGQFHGRNEGAVNNIYGSYSFAEQQSNDAAIVSNVGAMNRASAVGTATITNLRGSLNQCFFTGSTTITNVASTTNQITVNNISAIATNVYSCHNTITNTAGTITTAYGIYNLFSGTFGTKWGIYSDGDNKNYLTGDLGLGVVEPTQKLDVAGNIKTSTGYFVGSNQVIGARKTGWGVPTGTATRTAFATDTVTLIELARRVKAIIDDLNSTTGHGLIGS